MLRYRVGKAPVSWRFSASMMPGQSAAVSCRQSNAVKAVFEPFLISDKQKGNPIRVPFHFLRYFIVFKYLISTSVRTIHPLVFHLSAYVGHPSLSYEGNEYFVVPLAVFK